MSGLLMLLYPKCITSGQVSEPALQGVGFLCENPDDHLIYPEWKLAWLGALQVDIL